MKETPRDPTLGMHAVTFWFRATDEHTEWLRQTGAAIASAAAFYRPDAASRLSAFHARGVTRA